MSSRGPGGVFKSTTRAASGGALVIGIILALLFFKSGGEGDGDEDAEQSSDTPLVTNSDAGNSGVLDSLIPENGESESNGLSENEKNALAGGVLTILIDERDYLIGIVSETETTYESVTLERALTLAGRAEGDANGLKVRIERRESARASAEHLLLDELKAKDITEDAVHVTSEFVQ